jgi:hypothetical protein
MLSGVSDSSYVFFKMMNARLGRRVWQAASESFLVSDLRLCYDCLGNAAGVIGFLALGGMRHLDMAKYV